jgi:hypothetical protein
MNQTKTVSLDRFKGAVGFTLLLRRWGNARQGSLANITTTEDVAQDKKTKERIKLTKKLIQSKEYEAICTFQGGLRQWIYSRTTPSFFREGFQLVKLEGVDGIEKRLEAARDELSELVATLCLVFPGQVEEAKEALGDLFSERDYPATEDLERLFSIDWNWIAFTVPEGLPEELRQKEQDKLERQFSDAGEQITQALRSGFLELIQHASKRLESGPGEKPKIIRDTMIGNIKEFIETFSQRNLMNDADLQLLVNRANDILNGVTTQKLRDSNDLREKLKAEFDDVNAKLSTVIVEKKGRSFDLSVEE